mmetsp:Transcript_108646/g.339899  ORF Transcript_108646/g.339899 Transcript_108646/m.339899 type:complete len:285 (+) Transcript_108646:43-897(+)
MATASALGRTMMATRTLICAKPGVCAPSGPCSRTQPKIPLKHSGTHSACGLLELLLQIHGRMAQSAASYSGGTLTLTGSAGAPGGGCSGAADGSCDALGGGRSCAAGGCCSLWPEPGSSGTAAALAEVRRGGVWPKGPSASGRLRCSTEAGFTLAMGGGGVLTLSMRCTAAATLPATGVRTSGALAAGRWGEVASTCPAGGSGGSPSAARRVMLRRLIAAESSLASASAAVSSCCATAARTSSLWGSRAKTSQSSLRFAPVPLEWSQTTATWPPPADFETSAHS